MSTSNKCFNRSKTLNPPLPKMVPKILLFTFLLLQTQLKAQPVWHLIKDNNHIQVYTADAGSSNFKRIKVEGEFHGTLEKVIDIFLDIDKQKQWVYGTKRSYLIKKISDKDLLYYVETSLPWPLSNRDIAIRMNINEDKTNHSLTITTVGEPNAIQLNKGIVRVKEFKGDWHFTVTSKNQLKVDYLLFVDPGGSLPGWIVNMFITKGPYDTFSNLAELLKD